VEVIRTARDRGMRVIADLVVNHTSNKHPWFKAARTSRDSKFRDFYVWSDSPPKSAQAAPTFPDKENSVWTYDEKAGQYYLHRFYRYQPDLNVTNPLVRDEIAKIMGFWMQLGLSGFRVDAVPFFLETMGVPDAATALPDPHHYFRELRAMLNRRAGDAILLGEVNLSHEDQLEFFGGENGDELHMQFDFIGRRASGPASSAITTS
jgi:glycosidase